MSILLREQVFGDSMSLTGKTALSSILLSNKKANPVSGAEALSIYPRIGERVGFEVSGGVPING
jgi:hypothetical protein